MDVKDIRRLRPLLCEYLAQFDDCFRRNNTRAHLPVYVRGPLPNLGRKSVEPIALEERQQCFVGEIPKNVVG